MIYVRQLTTLNPISLLLHWVQIKTTDHFESHFITATLGSNKVTIGVTYNPPSGEDK